MLIGCKKNGLTWFEVDEIGKETLHSLGTSSKSKTLLELKSHRRCSFALVLLSLFCFLLKMSSEIIFTMIKNQPNLC